MRAWSRFWFAPAPTSTLALVRVAFGVVVLAWTVSLLPELGPLFSVAGVLPHRPAAGAGTWGVLDLVDGDGAVTATYLVLAAAAIALTAGYRTRIAAALVLVGIVSLQRRNPFVFNAGDVLLRTTAFYLLLAPAGAALSLDRLRRHGRERFWDAPARAPWALRLIQVQLSIVYLASVWAKVRGTTWNDGTAASYAARLEDLHRFALPHALTDTPLGANLLTYGTLAVELGVAILIWNRAWRPYVAAAGLGMHLAMGYSLRVGFFGPALAVSYLAFLPPERAGALIGAARDRAGRRGSAGAGRLPGWHAEEGDLRRPGALDPVAQLPADVAVTRERDLEARPRP